MESAAAGDEACGGRLRVEAEQTHCGRALSGAAAAVDVCHGAKPGTGPELGGSRRCCFGDEVEAVGNGGRHLGIPPWLRRQLRPPGYSSLVPWPFNFFSREHGW
jgi:hypothetical protein